MLTIKKILANSAELTRLQSRIRETGLLRGRSPDDRAQWQHACADFHARFDSLAFPGGSKAFTGQLKENEEALATAVRFLLADPYHFGSGYFKEVLWNRVRQCDVPPSMVDSLERAALLYLERRISREFWSMCKTMSRLGRSAFWRKVSSRAQITGTPEAIRALYLLTYGADIHAGAELRRSINWRVICERRKRAY